MKFVTFVTILVALATSAFAVDHDAPEANDVPTLRGLITIDNQGDPDEASVKNNSNDSDDVQKVRKTKEVSGESCHLCCDDDYNC